MSPPKPRASPALVDRELNGTVLLEELQTLRSAGIPPSRLVACDAELESLAGMEPGTAGDLLADLAVSHLADVPALAQLLVRWSPRLRLPGDVPLFRAHFRRLALTAGLLQALWQAGARRGPNRGSP